jgi:hypothetical protein
MLVFLAQSFYDYFSLARDHKRPQFVTISYSHYVELARWSLEISKTPFDEHCFAPGQHILPAISVRVAKNGSRNFSTSSTMTGSKPSELPALISEDGQVFKDSWEIAEEFSGLPPISSELKDILDKELGIKCRQYIYSVLLKPQHANTFTKMCTDGRHWAWCLLWYSGLGFVLKSMLRHAMKTSIPTEVKACKEQVEHLMSTKLAAYVKERKGKFLDGDKLGQADIALAALAAPLVIPEEYGGRHGTMWPYASKILATDPEFKEFFTKMRATVVGEYCLQIYIEYRI